jgi:uncharacterized protein (TIGR03435 family)
LSASLIFISTQVRAQSAPSDWEKAAGGKMAFDVASVKPNKSGPQQPGDSNIPLGDRDNYPRTGGLFSGTNLSLGSYTGFAYKLTFNQGRLLSSQLPKWAAQDRFDIVGRAQGNPTKDQMRLMMQSLLADRFKLMVHFETRQIPVFELVIAKPPQLGPQLRLHVDDPPCPASGPSGSPGDSGGTVRGGFPIHCGAFMPIEATAPGRQRMGARNIPWELFANYAGLMGRVADRPVVDRTGLSGTVDFVIEWTPAVPSTPDFQPDLSSPTFPEALQDQLGLKLNSEVDPVQILVIDHVEEPSAN